MKNWKWWNFTCWRKLMKDKHYFDICNAFETYRLKMLSLFLQIRSSCKPWKMPCLWRQPKWRQGRSFRWDAMRHDTGSGNVDNPGTHERSSFGSEINERLQTWNVWLTSVLNFPAFSNCIASAFLKCCQRCTCLRAN